MDSMRAEFGNREHPFGEGNIGRNQRERSSSAPQNQLAKSPRGISLLSSLNTLLLYTKHQELLWKDRGFEDEM